MWDKWSGWWRVSVPWGWRAWPRCSVALEGLASLSAQAESRPASEQRKNDVRRCSRSIQSADSENKIWNRVYVMKRKLQTFSTLTRGERERERERERALWHFEKADFLISIHLASSLPCSRTNYSLRATSGMTSTRIRGKNGFISFGKMIRASSFNLNDATFKWPEINQRVGWRD